MPPVAELPPDLDETIRTALDEDIGPGDVTTHSVVPQDTEVVGRFVAREEGVVAGIGVAYRVFSRLGAVRWDQTVDDGDRVGPATRLATIRGEARTVLTGERVALNFLTHLSGIATLTRRYVEACSDTESVILCTRKTLPGLRSLERYAVQQGGGVLHRAGLYEAVLIKDNHVAVAGGVGEAVRRARAGADGEVEVEVDTLDQLHDALEAGADRILLDNPTVETVERALDVVAGRVPLEVSGGMTIEKVRRFAPLGPLQISVGRITHSAPALDISLEVDPAG